MKKSRGKDLSFSAHESVSPVQISGIFRGIYEVSLPCKRHENRDTDSLQICNVLLMGCKLMRSAVLRRRQILCRQNIITIFFHGLRLFPLFVFASSFGTFENQQLKRESAS